MSATLLASMDEADVVVTCTTSKKYFITRAKRKAGRVRDDEVIIFDSTGTGLQDVAAAIAVYHRALAEKAGSPIRLAEKELA